MLSLLFSLWLSIAVPPVSGWFYASRVPLEYPGAYSYMLDGPYKLREHCEDARANAIEIAKAFAGMRFEAQPCVERKSA